LSLSSATISAGGGSAAFPTPGSTTTGCIFFFAQTLQHQPVLFLFRRFSLDLTLVLEVQQRGRHLGDRSGRRSCRSRWFAVVLGTGCDVRRHGQSSRQITFRELDPGPHPPLERDRMQVIGATWSPSSKPKWRSAQSRAGIGSNPSIGRPILRYGREEGSHRRPIARTPSRRQSSFSLSSAA
jgi:hypothetical protein